MENFSIPQFRKTIRKSSAQIWRLNQMMDDLEPWLTDGRDLDAEQQLLLAARMTEVDEVLSRLRVEMLLFASTDQLWEYTPFKGGGMSLPAQMLKRRAWWQSAWRNFLRRYIPPSSWPDGFA